MVHVIFDLDWLTVSKDIDVDFELFALLKEAMRHKHDLLEALGREQSTEPGVQGRHRLLAQKIL